MTEVCVFTEPQQGATYDQLLAVAQRAEQLNFTGFFRSDHYLAMGSASGLPGPTDAWVTLGGLARETKNLRLGTLVTSATFRNPGPLAIAVSGVDQMSGGRVELGLGAGWYEAEHTAYGLRFPGVAERFEIFTEQLEIISGLWSTPHRSPFDYNGRYYQLADSPALPKPVQQPRIPIIIGGGGKIKTAKLAARFAQEFNRAFVPLKNWTDTVANVARRCEEIGRNPASLRNSVALVSCCGQNESEVLRRAAAIGRSAEDLRANGAAGTPTEVIDKLRGYVAAGAGRVYFQIMDLSDLDHLQLLAEEVVPHL